MSSGLVVSISFLDEYERLMSFISELIRSYVMNSRGQEP